MVECTNACAIACLQRRRGCIWAERKRCVGRCDLLPAFQRWRGRMGSGVERQGKNTEQEKSKLG